VSAIPGRHAALVIGASYTFHDGHANPLDLLRSALPAYAFGAGPGRGRGYRVSLRGGVGRAHPSRSRGSPRPVRINSGLHPLRHGILSGRICEPVVAAILADTRGEPIEIGTLRPRAPYEPVTVGTLANLDLGDSEPELSQKLGRLLLGALPLTHDRARGGLVLRA
jgi:hypothetical protein